MKGADYVEKNNRNTILAIAASASVLTFGGFAFHQIQQNHLTNEQIIETCFDNFDDQIEVVIKNKGFWSTVTCEQK